MASLAFSQPDVSVHGLKKVLATKSILCILTRGALVLRFVRKRDTIAALGQEVYKIQTSFPMPICIRSPIKPAFTTVSLHGLIYRHSGTQIEYRYSVEAVLPLNGRFNIL